MKILHFLKSPRAEGTVKLVLDWLEVSEYEQEVFVLQSDPPEMRAALKLRARWYGETDALPRSARKFPWLIQTARRVCTARRPDLIVCWPNGFSPWILTGARMAGVNRLVTHAGNPPTRTFSGRLQTLFSTSVAALVNARMVCCSNYVAEQYQRSFGVNASILRAIHNCAPVDQIRRAAAEARAGRTDQRPCAIMVATLERHKDHATLLTAMPDVFAAMPNARLWLVGDGSLRVSLEQQADRLGLGERVTFLGSRQDVPSLLGQADVFVFSTTPEEGLGTVLVEALAAGLPVVASDVPACRELLDHGKWGTLVRSGRPSEWASAVVTALKEPARGRRVPSDAYLERFAPAEMIRSYINSVN